MLNHKSGSLPGRPGVETDGRSPRSLASKMISAKVSKLNWVRLWGNLFLRTLLKTVEQTAGN